MGRVIVRPDAAAVEVDPEWPVLRLLLARDRQQRYSCRRGLCGQDLIRILSGCGELNGVQEREAETLQMLGVAAPEFRLACCTRVVGSGTVEIEVV